MIPVEGRSESIDARDGDHVARAGRALIVTRNFPPLLGGMEKVIHSLYTALADTYSVHLVGPAGCEQHINARDAASPCQLVPTWRFLLSSFREALATAASFQPQIVMAGSGLMAPAVVVAARRAGARSICYLHGLDLVASHPVYKSVFIPAIRRAGTVIVNSRNTGVIARELGIADERIALLHPCISMPAPRAPDTENFRRRYGCEGKTVLLSVGRLTARKGIAEFVQHAMPLLREKFGGNVHLIVVGEDAAQAVRALSGQRQAILDAARQLDLQKDVTLLGRVDGDALAAAYMASDVFVLPVLQTSNDVEGFGIVAVEAASYGLATVAFDVGGVGDAVASEQSGYLVPSGDYRAFADRVWTHCREAASPVTPEGCRAFAGQFVPERFRRRLLSIVSGAEAGQGR